MKHHSDVDAKEFTDIFFFSPRWFLTSRRWSVWQASCHCRQWYGDSSWCWLLTKPITGRETRPWWKLWRESYTMNKYGEDDYDWCVMVKAKAKAGCLVGISGLCEARSKVEVCRELWWASGNGLLCWLWMRYVDGVVDGELMVCGWCWWYAEAVLMKKKPWCFNMIGVLLLLGSMILVW